MKIQKAIYPAKDINITQVPYNTYSHKGNPAWDEAYNNSGISWASAPFTLKYVGKDSASRANATCFWSCDQNGKDTEVLWANGKITKTTIYALHRNNISGYWVGEVYKQFEPFTQEGTAGQATGNHNHFEVAAGHTLERYQNGYNVRMTRNSVDPTKVFFLLDGYSRVISTKGLTFKKTTSAEFNYEKFITVLASNQMTLKDKIGGKVLEWLDKGEKFVVTKVLPKHTDGFEYVETLGGVIQLDPKFIKLTELEPEVEVPELPDMPAKGMELFVLKSGMTLRDAAEGKIIESNLAVGTKYKVLEISSKKYPNKDGNNYQWVKTDKGFIQFDNKYVNVYGKVEEIIAPPQEKYEIITEKLYRKI